MVYREGLYVRGEDRIGIQETSPLISGEIPIQRRILIWRIRKNLNRRMACESLGGGDQWVWQIKKKIGGKQGPFTWREKIERQGEESNRGGTIDSWRIRE